MNLLTTVFIKNQYLVQKELQKESTLSKLNVIWDQDLKAAGSIISYTDLVSAWYLIDKWFALWSGGPLIVIRNKDYAIKFQPTLVMTLLA